EIDKVREMGVMEGEGNLFYPDRNLSRAEAVTTLNRVLDRGPLTGDFSPSWPDVTASHWSFGHVEEASRTHESSRISDKAEQLIRFRD
ncbi:MAG: S-layer domain protein, partial [Paenibacillaceae bacterium]|nr:S-layer domain protein [Paenibacillaceae bacterium]